jgi:tetratricopeptide (TPR) repeat protein
VLAALGIYAGQLSGPFIFDDVQSIVENQTLRSFSAALSPPRETPVAGRPLANLSFAIDYALHGSSPAAFHATNLALHCACVLLAFVVLLKLLAADGLPAWLTEHAREHAFLAALMFCVHPMVIELVLYTSQRTETLVALCYLAAALLLLSAAVDARRSWLHAFLLAVLGVLGICAKEVFVTAPFVLLLCDRAFYAGSLRAALQKRWMLYVSLCMCWPVAWLLQRSGPRSDSVHFYSLDYVLTQARIVPEYFAHALSPGAPQLDYGQLWPQDLADGWPWLVFSAGAVLVASIWAWRAPRTGFVWCWALLILAPSSSLLTIHTEIGAERRFYLPLIAVLASACVAVSALLERALREQTPQRRRAARRIAFMLALCSCGLLGLLTRSYTEDFRSLRAFWTAAVRARPDNARAHYNLAETLRREGDIPGAVASFRSALQIQEGYGEAHSNLAALLSATGQFNEALSHAERGVELAMNSPIAHYTLAVTCALSGQLERAISELEVTLRLAPDHWDARRNLAKAYLMLGRPRAAREHAQMVLAHIPNDALAQKVVEQTRASVK